MAHYSCKCYNHIVAGITHYIVKSCTGGLKLSTRTMSSPYRLLFSLPSEPQLTATSKKRKETCYTSIRCDIRDSCTHSNIQRSKVNIVKLQIKYYKLQASDSTNAAFTFKLLLFWYLHNSEEALVVPVYDYRRGQGY